MSDDHEDVLYLKHEVRELKRSQSKDHDLLGRVRNLVFAAVGENGKNGKLGYLQDEVDTLYGKQRTHEKESDDRFEDHRERIHKLELRHVMTMAISFVGAVAGSALSPKILSLLSQF